MSEKELDERELDERELADKLTSFAKAVNGGEPDSTILAMLNDFEASDPPSENTLRVCKDILLISSSWWQRTCKGFAKRHLHTQSLSLPFLSHSRERPNMSSITNPILHATENRRRQARR